LSDQKTKNDFVWVDFVGWDFEKFFFKTEHGNMPLIPFSANLEQKIETMSPEQYKAWCEENKSQSAIPRIVTTGFKVFLFSFLFFS
jgi:hypothetical protein